jgi:aminoglycoside 6'-N-acetyltransferase I
LFARRRYAEQSHFGLTEDTVVTMVRPIEARDIAAWAAMRSRLWPQADADGLTREAREYVAGSAGDMLAAAFVAEDDAASHVGFIEVGVRPYSDGCDSMPVPHVEGWYVRPDARGRGVGRQLMDAAERWSRTRGFSEIASDTEVHNAASAHAHHACGFEEVDRLIKFRKLLG